MGFFKKKKNSDNIDTLKLLEEHDKGLLNDADFLKKFGKAIVYYSTPYGDHKDGEKRVFLLPGPEKTGYFPVFPTMERAVEFYEKVGRVGYAIMEGDFHSVLVTTQQVNISAPVKMGVLVDPGYAGITVDEANLNLVIKMTE